MKNENLLKELREYMVGSNSYALPSEIITEIYNENGISGTYTYNDALEYIESPVDGVGECPCCKWVCDDLYNYHSEHESVCYDCQEEEE